MSSETITEFLSLLLREGKGEREGDGDGDAESEILTKRWSILCLKAPLGQLRGRQLPKRQLPAQPWLAVGQLQSMEGGVRGGVIENKRVTRSRLGQSGRPSQPARGRGANVCVICRTVVNS